MSTLSGSVTFDQSTNLYTYTYAVANDGGSTIWNVDILVGNTLLGTYLGLQPIPAPFTAPDGWTMYGAFSGSIASAPYNMSGGFYEFYGGNHAIQAATANTDGFSVTTSFAPTTDNGLNDYFLYGSAGIVGFGNVVVPDGAEWLAAPPPMQSPQVSMPEPATWAMLLLGFMAICFLKRRPAKSGPQETARRQQGGPAAPILW